METKTQCVKVAELRKAGYLNLEDWMKNENNVYVGRNGRVWITEKKENGENEKRIFHYPGSTFANPYKVTKDMPLEESLHLYRIHLEENGLLEHIEELRGKTLGCFCDQKGDCHAKVLASLLNLVKNKFIIFKIIN